ncbi:putative CoA-substrate-specific enzyme activase [Rhodoblastus acidophilus]|uniref:acyl-CoA dehydratase activase n=1 Tax=Rhodoblastus acidophilus TaxID=1074 RepID=UPI0022244F65|nr:acyl-CoA dehydratase activase [Rhodoblastus acidophilus]MCW2285430.1 putative CoA-substrate-specific enzyme activase [Rhodoblastus acidophilus]MCW2334321.1 putative CoA-substrate-specific enzyme activase [Rhodoblastus acidophilus]
MFLGIDVGSRACKAVLMGEAGVIAHRVVDTGAAPKTTAETLIARILAEAGAQRAKAIVATGYGRVSLTGVDRTVTELSCHGRGAHFLNPNVRTVIDIGGQDSKAIRIDEDGAMLDFAMNDRCAAGTGRFMEGVARVLEAEVDGLADMGGRATKPCTINSMCAVFAESEVISLLSQGFEKEDVAAGVLLALARRVANLARGVGVKAQVAFVGGAAKNAGLRKALAETLGVDLVSFKTDPQIVGALGAALIAQEVAQEAAKELA